MAYTPVQKIGLFVAAFAACCLYFGVVWSFDNGLLMLGNVALLMSFGLILGPWSVLALFIGGARGVLPFLLGVALVFYNFRLLGMIIELYGACLLVTAALPHWLDRAKGIPYLGRVVSAIFPTERRNNTNGGGSPPHRRRVRQSSNAENTDSDNEEDWKRIRNGTFPRQRSPKLGRKVDGSWADVNTEYDADRETTVAGKQSQRTGGNRNHVMLGAIGRRSTVA